jgi:competence ComEA-like helix-hairpin-helix protein
VWGRELRAGLVFVLVSVLAGGAFRAWEREHRERLDDVVSALAERDAAARASSGAASPAGGAGDAGVAPATGAPGSGAPIPEDRSRGAGARRPDAAPPRPASVDPDRATVEEWLRLPGIGPALAARIVADRAAHGRFGAPEGLLRVPGIGPKTLAKIRLYLAPPADPAPAAVQPAESDRAK